MDKELTGKEKRSIIEKINEINIARKLVLIKKVDIKNKNKNK